MRDGGGWEAVKDKSRVGEKEAQEEERLADMEGEWACNRWRRERDS